MWSVNRINVWATVLISINDLLTICEDALSVKFADDANIFLDDSILNELQTLQKDCLLPLINLLGRKIVLSLLFLHLPIFDIV